MGAHGMLSCCSCKGTPALAPTCLIPEQVKQHRATALSPRKSSQRRAVDRRRAGERSQGVSDTMVPLSRTPTRPERGFQGRQVRVRQREETRLCVRFSAGSTVTFRRWGTNHTESERFVTLLVVGVLKGRVRSPTLRRHRGFSAPAGRRTMGKFPVVS